MSTVKVAVSSTAGEKLAPFKSTSSIFKLCIPSAIPATVTGVTE